MIKHDFAECDMRTDRVSLRYDNMSVMSDMLQSEGTRCSLVHHVNHITA